MNKKVKQAIKDLRNQGEIVVVGKGMNELHLPMGVKTGIFDALNKKLERPINEKSINIKLNGKKI